MYKLNQDFISLIIIKYIEQLNFNPILKLVSHKFNYLYNSIKSKVESKWLKYNLYNSYIPTVKTDWRKFKIIWDFNYKEITYNKNIILNNYCQFYILKKIVHQNCKLLIEFYNGYPNISKKRIKIITEIYNDIDLEIRNKDFSNFTFITPQFKNNMFTEEQNKISNKYYAFLLGPPKTVYENGIFVLEFEIFDKLFTKTIVKFLNKIYHPNIDFNTGIVNIDILNESWQPIYGGNPRILMLSIYSVLIQPELSNYNPKIDISNDIIKEYNINNQVYIEKAKKYVTLYASFTINKLINILYSN